MLDKRLDLSWSLKRLLLWVLENVMKTIGLFRTHTTEKRSGHLAWHTRRDCFGKFRSVIDRLRSHILLRRGCDEGKVRPSREKSRTNHSAERQPPFNQLLTGRAREKHVLCFIGFFSFAFSIRSLLQGERLLHTSLTGRLWKIYSSCRHRVLQPPSQIARETQVVVVELSKKPLFALN